MATPSSTSTPSGVHTSASSGFINGAAYDTHRPSYTAAAVDALLHGMNVAGAGTHRIVEIAAGTGKFTDLLARPQADPATTYEVRAVEPLEPMREVLVGRNLPRVSVFPGTAASMPVEDGWGDACIAAQAFHWFANDDALREMHRVVKPGGYIGMIWNVENYNMPRAWKATTEWEQQVNELNWSVPVPHESQFRHEHWREAFDSAAAKQLYELPIGEKSVPWTVWLAPDALYERIRTLSHIHILEGEKLDAFKKRYDEIVGGVAAGGEEMNDKGELAVHGIAHVAWAKRV